MPRYSINPRPIYDPNEPAGWQGSLAGGIGDAISEWQRRREIARQEGNQVRAQGGVEQPPVAQPSPMDRVRGIAGGIGDLLHGRRPVFSGPQIEGRQRDGMPAGTMTPPPPATPVSSVPPREPFGADPFGMGSGRVEQSRYPADPYQAHRPGINPALASQGTSGGISAAIQPYDYEGIQGKHYAVDPLHGARVQAATRQMTTDVDEERKVSSLVAAGMPEAEARARVRNNVVRYDETFGQQPRAGGLTFDQRKQLQDEAIRARYNIARLSSAGRTDSAEYRQAALALREIEVRLRAAGFEAEGAERSAASTERTIPHGTDRIVEESQPGGKTRITDAERRAAALRDSASTIRRGAAAEARGALGGRGAASTTGAGAKRTISQAQYDQAIAKGHTDAQIAAAYNIPATVKRAHLPATR